MTRRPFAALLAALMLAGCSTSYSTDPAGGLGATPGGAKDVALARKKVAEGQVPDAADFVVEGFYSEHDLPLEGPPCGEVLCLRAAMAIAPAFDTGRQEAFVQVGFSSGVDPATFRRKPLDVALVIDHSGSMMGEPMQAVKDAARALVAKLDEHDTFSLVIFDDTVTTLVEQTPVVHREALLDAIARIEPDGSTCIECGLLAGFEQLATRERDPARARRLFLFTDALPNVGASGEGDFMALLRAHSQQGRDATVFGVGISFNQALVTMISSVRGANYFYLSDAERTRKVFDEDFDYLVTPLAYDLRMALTPAQGFQVEAVYGLPGVAPGASEVSLDVATVFLSRNKGAVLARLSMPGQVRPTQEVSTQAFSFLPVEAAAPRQTTLSARYEGGETLPSTAAWYSQGSVRKTVALTNFILGARRACDTWAKGDKAGAREVADRAADLLHAEAEALDDAALRAEVDFARKLAALMVP